MTSVYSDLSPALLTRSAEYPFGERVPRKVEMTRTSFPPFAAGVDTVDFPIAYVGMRYRCYVASCGALAVILPGDQYLQVETGAFRVVEYH